MYDILGLLKYWKENFYMRSLEKYLSEANLGNWTHLLWQNGYTTPEEFIEIGIVDLKLIEIPEREINALLEVVDNIKKDMVDAQEFSSEESVYYLERDAKDIIGVPTHYRFTFFTLLSVNS
jgi:hypothetical protein